MDNSAQGETAVLAAFRTQIGWCTQLDAPFTARLLELLAADLERGGAVHGLVGDWPGDPVADAVALRLAGAFHALVLTDRDPALAACYPEGDGGPEALPGAVQAALLRHDAYLRAFLTSPPQTNEVGRSAVLLGGFLEVAARTGLPLRLLEIGSSAGLNLIWDRYRYAIAGAAWGDPASPVLLAPEWTGPAPLLAAPVTIASRAGCDIAPLDLQDDAARLRLRSYVWADQPERLARVEGAVALARAGGTEVERADAGAWVAARLGAAVSGQATVLYHSIMWQYMPAATREALRASIAAAEAGATETAPFAWLRFEPDSATGRPALRLTCWPGGVEERLATAHPHGRSVVWMEPGGRGC